MDGVRPIIRLRTLVIPAILTALTAPGCAGDRPRRPIAPFGSVRTYTETVVPGPAGHPRGQMIAPQAPGIDLVRRPGATDPRPVAGTSSAVDPSARPASAIDPR